MAVTVSSLSMFVLGSDHSHSSERLDTPRGQVEQALWSDDEQVRISHDLRQINPRSFEWA